MFMVRRAAAKARGVAFNITIDDLPRLPMYCPALGLKLEFHEGQAKDNSYSLDRIEPSLGYIRGNLQWLSQKANQLKSDGSPEEFRKLLSHLERTRN